jgi:hypothetical protein
MRSPLHHPLPSSNQLDGTLSPDFGAGWPLEEINLSANNFTGPLPKQWAKMSKLTTLVLA